MIRRWHQQRKSKKESARAPAAIHLEDSKMSAHHPTSAASALSSREDESTLPLMGDDHPTLWLQQSCDRQNLPSEILGNVLNWETYTSREVGDNTAEIDMPNLSSWGMVVVDLSEDHKKEEQTPNTAVPASIPSTMTLIDLTQDSQHEATHRADTTSRRRAKRKWAGPEVTCHICLSDGGETKIPRNGKVTRRCPQPRTICESCLQRHIQACVVDNQNYDNIRCLCIDMTTPRTPFCQVTLSHRHVKRYATAETFRRYDEGMLQRQLEQNPDFVWCARPGCGSGQLHPQREREPRMQCHACNYATCFFHRCEWHQGRTCNQYSIEINGTNSPLAQMVGKKKSKHFRTCPSCRQGVEKNGGCDHMTCRCKHEFCWICLAAYTGANGIHTKGASAHDPSCSKYVPQTNMPGTQWLDDDSDFWLSDDS